MAFTLNRRLSTLVASNGQLNTGKIPNGEITTAMLHSGFTVSSGHLGSIDSDAVSEGSSNLYFTNARVDSRLSGGTGVTYSSGAISIGQAVATTDNVTFADLTVTGNLTITGDIDSYNVTDLDVTDKTITIGKGQSESNSGGSGLIVDGASASILWDESNDEFDINKGLNVTGDLVVDTNTLKVDATNNRVGILNASPDVTLDLGSATDGIHMPVGTTGQRPSSPAAGYFRYNSTDGQFEGYTTEWGAIAGSGGSAKEVDNFTGDGSTTAFTLSSTVADEDNLMVFIEGVYQNKADFVASGTTLTFDAAPANGRKVVVHHVKSSISGTNTILDSFSANGSTTAFTLTLAPGSENNTQIFIDGVYQQKTDYTVSGTTLTFDTAPANGATIEVMIFTQTTVNAPAANTVGVSQLNLSDGSSGQAIVTDGSGTISFGDVGVAGISSSADATAITIGSDESVDFAKGIVALGSGTTAGVYLNGTNSDSITQGNFLRYGTNFATQSNAANSELITYAFNGSSFQKTQIVKSNGAVELYYGNNKVLETQSGAVQISSHGTGGNLNLFSDSGTNEGQFNITYLTDGTSAGHSVGEIRMQQGSGNGSARKGEILFRVSDGGGPTSRMHILSDGEIVSGPSAINDTYSPLVNGLTSDALVVGRHSTSGSLGLWRTNTMEWKYYHNGIGYVMTFGSNGVLSGDFNDTSDLNLKENISTIEDGTTVIKALRPVKFDWKASEKGNNQHGFIAQEVETVLPDAVEGNDYVENATGLPDDEPANNGKNMNSNAVLAHAVKAIQEQQIIIEDLKSRIETLEG